MIAHEAVSNLFALDQAVGIKTLHNTNGHKSQTRLQIKFDGSDQLCYDYLKAEGYTTMTDSP